MFEQQKETKEQFQDNVNVGTSVRGNEFALQQL